MLPSNGSIEFYFHFVTFNYNIHPQILKEEGSHHDNVGLGSVHPFNTYWAGASYTRLCLWVKKCLRNFCLLSHHLIITPTEVLESEKKTHKTVEPVFVTFFTQGSTEEKTYIEKYRWGKSRIIVVCIKNNTKLINNNKK